MKFLSSQPLNSEKIFLALSLFSRRSVSYKSTAGHKCIVFNFFSDLNHNIILCKRSAPYLNLIFTLLPALEILHVPVTVVSIFVKL